MAPSSNILDPTPATISKAARLLREGKLVAFPTETVYGLGADATSDEAVASIFAAKGRPQFNPLIVHVETLEQAERIGMFDERAHDLARRFWPGALTLVVPRRKDCGIAWLASAGLETIALRCPAQPIARALLQAFGGPIAAPSANRSGTVTATTARHVAESLGAGVDLIIDGGPALSMAAIEIAAQVAKGRAVDNAARMESVAIDLIVAAPGHDIHTTAQVLTLTATAPIATQRSLPAHKQSLLVAVAAGGPADRGGSARSSPSVCWSSSSLG